jgi:hypothetical protein
VGIISYFKRQLVKYDSNSNSAEINWNLCLNILQELIKHPRGPVGYKDSSNSYMRIAIRGSGNAIVTYLLPNSILSPSSSSMGMALSGRTTRR